jgi:hypothetical protein
MKDWKDIILEQDKDEPLSIMFEKTELKEKEMNELFCHTMKAKKSTKIKPTHYKSDNDVIRFCIDNNIGFCEGNVIKYVRRWKEKNGVEDLMKAKEYLERLISS